MQYQYTNQAIPRKKLLVRTTPEINRARVYTRHPTSHERSVNTPLVSPKLGKL